MQHLQLLDFAGASLSFIATCYFIRANSLAWPVSLLAICIDIYLYWHKGIYGDSGLQMVYLVTVCYGWWQWLYGGEKHTNLPITHIKLQSTLVLSACALLAWVGVALFLSAHTNSQVPYWDATTTVLSLAAQWLTCRKIIENWVVWFVVDILFAGLYFYKNIPAHACLQLIYLAMAVIGYLNWKKMSYQHKTASTPTYQH